MDTTGSFDNAITADLYRDPSFVCGFLKDNVYRKIYSSSLMRLETEMDTETETKSDNFTIMNST